MAPFASVTNSATRCCWTVIPGSDTNCISSKFGNQAPSPALPHCFHRIALLSSSVSFELLSSSARVTLVKSQQGLLPIDLTPGIPGWKLIWTPRTNQVHEVKKIPLSQKNHVFRFFLHSPLRWSRLGLQYFVRSIAAPVAKYWSAPPPPNYCFFSSSRTLFFKSTTMKTSLSWYVSLESSVK